MKRLLPLVLFALVACEPREGPSSPETEATPTAAAVPTPPPNVAPPPAPAPPTAPPVVPTAAPTTAPAASAAPVAPLGCGDKQCAPNQICVEAQIPQGTPPREGTAPTTTTFTCANEPMKGAGFQCSEPKDRRQQCRALVPAASK